MEKKDKKNTYDDLENKKNCQEGAILFDPEDELSETEKMSPEEKKEYLDFLWRRRFFSC